MTLAVAEWHQQISPSKACTDSSSRVPPPSCQAVIVIGVPGSHLPAGMDQAKIVDSHIHALANVFEGKAPLWCFCCSISS